MKYHYAHTRMAEVEKTDHIECWQGCVNKRNSHALLMRMQKW